MAISLIKELLSQIESGEVIVDGINTQEPNGGYVLRKDGSLLEKLTELKLIKKDIR